MTNHVAYWTERAREGISIVFGPVADPAGVYGTGVYRVDNEEQMRRLLDDDPANGLLHYEVTPMLNAVVGPEVARNGQPSRLTSIYGAFTSARRPLSHDHARDA